MKRSGQEAKEQAPSPFLHARPPIPIRFDSPGIRPESRRS